MSFKVRLFNEIIGDLTTDHVDGLNALSFNLHRSEEYEGIVFETILDFSLIKDARDFVLACFNQAGGIDAVVYIDVLEYDDNSRSWEVYSQSQINFNQRDTGETDVIVAIEQAGIERQVLNAMEVDVDLETTTSQNGAAIPAQSTQMVPFHSKPLLKEYYATPPDSSEQQITADPPATFGPNLPDVRTGYVWYGQIDTNKETLTELEDTFAGSWGFEAFPYQGLFGQDSSLMMPYGAGTDAAYIDYLSYYKRKLLKGATEPEAIAIDPRNPRYVAKEAGTMDINVRLKMKHKVTAVNDGGDVDIVDTGCLGNVEVYAWCEGRSANNEITFLEKIGQWDMDGIGGTERVGVFETKTYSKLGITVSKGDSFFVYLTYRVWGEYEGPGALEGTGTVTHTFTHECDHTVSYIQFKNLTVFEETDVKGILLHEAVERCVQYYSDRPISYYSTLTGRTDLGYAEDGEASMILVTNGHWLRGRDDGNFLSNGQKRLFDSLKGLFSFINSQFCVGFGFETVDADGLLPGIDTDTGLDPGTQVFRLEKRSHFYRKDDAVVDLGRVYKPRVKLVSKMYNNQFEFGSAGKLDIGQINSIDEFNTMRKNKIPIRSAKESLKTYHDYRTSGFQIEFQRRLTSSTKDSNLDDEIFMVVVRRDGLGYVTAKDEDFESITGVRNPELGYNYKLSPAHARENWKEVLASMLIRSADKIVKFSSGEGNYSMVTKKPGEPALSESSDLDLTGVTPWYDPEVYILQKVKLTRAQFRAIRANPYGVISFQDVHGNEYEGYISPEGLVGEPNIKQGLFRLLKVHR